MSSPAVLAARHFFETFWSGCVPEDKMLLAALDRLIAAYHDTSERQEIGADVDAPVADWKDTYEQSGARFPSFGLYVALDPTELDLAPLAHDAIGDIADVTTDMRTVLWVAETICPAKADAVFRASFIHWGEHARGLAWLLHHRIASEAINP